MTAAVMPELAIAVTRTAAIRTSFGLLAPLGLPAAGCGAAHDAGGGPAGGNGPFGGTGPFDATGLFEGSGLFGAFGPFGGSGPFGETWLFGGTGVFEGSGLFGGTLRFEGIENAAVAAPATISVETGGAASAGKAFTGASWAFWAFSEALAVTVMISVAVIGAPVMIVSVGVAHGSWAAVAAPTPGVASERVVAPRLGVASRRVVTPTSGVSSMRVVASTPGVASRRVVARTPGVGSMRVVASMSGVFSVSGVVSGAVVSSMPGVAPVFAGETAVSWSYGVIGASWASSARTIVRSEVVRVLCADQEATVNGGHRLNGFPADPRRSR
ncbi:hypothetical protein MB27_20115 [Actinoplanes utahensis]|uniref:Uncharacterized protein n=1 Tax=Actinoplanes utahensis TaxID=1869 RepID=A0A0A6UNQ7_ACTUT|nr:hypothetical protein MB27_20115 [Actinoplanes utahensis]